MHFSFFFVWSSGIKKKKGKAKRRKKCGNDFLKGSRERKRSVLFNLSFVMYEYLKANDEKNKIIIKIKLYNTKH